MIALLQRFLLVVLALYFHLAAACTAKPEIVGEVGPKLSTRERLERFVATFGDAVIQTKGTEAVKKYAPHLMPALDLDGNGVLSLPELMQLDVEDPATLAMLLLAIEEAVRENRK